MADEKISDFPAASSAADADVTAGVQGGTNKKFSMSVVKAYILAAFNSVYVPLTRTLTIGGSAKTLAADRTWATTDILDSLGTAQGDVIYRGSANWVVLTPGTDGNQLTTHGAGANPTWDSGTVVTPAALTKTNDTNVTLTLGGTPTTALLQATSLALGWTSTLSQARGGFGKSTASTTDGQIPIGKTSDGSWNVNTLTAGTGISVTNGAGTISIAATGGGSVTNIATTSPITGGPITTTGTIALDVGVNHAFTAAQGITVNDATNNAVTNVLILDHETSGAPAASMGVGIKAQLQDSTTANVDVGGIRWLWISPTHVSHESAIVFSAVNTTTPVDVARMFAYNGGGGSLSVGGSTNPGSAGIVDAAAGYRAGSVAATSGKILQGDGDVYRTSSPTWPTAAGTANKVVQSNGTNLLSQFLKGTTTNDSAAAGEVGQEIESLVAAGSAVSLTTATAANITSISLTAGDWNVGGNVNFTETTSTVTARSSGISTTSATLPTDGSEVYCGVQSVVTSEINSITLPRKRISISGTTTVYLVGIATFSAGTCAGFGAIVARRVR